MQAQSLALSGQLALAARIQGRGAAHLSNHMQRDVQAVEPAVPYSQLGHAGHYGTALQREHGRALREPAIRTQAILPKPGAASRPYAQPCEGAQVPKAL